MNRAASVLLLTVIVSPLIAAESDRYAEDRTAIQENIAAYVKAFNHGDAEAMASQWSEHGVWISPSGHKITGRASIKDEMVDYFSESRRQTLIVTDTQIRFVTPTVAIEEGKARVSAADEAPEDSSYMAVHIKKRGQWKLDTVREVASPAVTTNFEHLKPLEWMIGSWVDEDGDSVIETTCRWTKNKNFMTRSFRVTTDEDTDLEGTQVIGYDAVKKQIRSWVFDTDGGIGEAVWTQHGDRWIIKALHSLPDGEKGSSVNVITCVDNDTFIWQSTGREVGGRIMPDIDPVTVIRKQ